MSERWVLDVNSHPLNLAHVYKLTASTVNGQVVLIALLSQEVAGNPETSVTLKGTWATLTDARAAARRLVEAVDLVDYGDAD